MTNDQPDPYAGSGVDYGVMDAAKKFMQQRAAATARGLNGKGFRSVPWSRGESVFLVESDVPPMYLGHVEEGLGTKILLADAMSREDLELAYAYYAAIGKDAAAMILNDMSTLGVSPLTAAQHLAAGSAHWFKNEARIRGLADGWAQACLEAGCAWGGGETPTLRDIVYPDASVIGGSAMGIVMPKSQVINPATITHGDAIVILPSSGVHANGLTYIRTEIAEKHGYLTEVAPGETLGGALLKPTPIYEPVVRQALSEGLRLHSFVPITGHGWAKLMRAKQPAVYAIDVLPVVHPEMEFIADRSQLSPRDAYKLMNMGGGAAVYLPRDDVDAFLTVCAAGGMAGAFVAGSVYKEGHRREVVLPNGVTFTPDDLDLR